LPVYEVASVRKEVRIQMWPGEGPWRTDIFRAAVAEIGAEMESEP